MYRLLVLLAAFVCIFTFGALGLAGPEAEAQDAKGQPGFVVQCDFIRHAQVDPIVNPGEESAHLHALQGGYVHSTSTREDLLDRNTTCNSEADHSGYWQPALIKDGDRIQPLGVHVYYRIGKGVNPESVRAYPAGLKVVVGDGHSTSPQSIVQYSCSGQGGDGSEIVGDKPVNCPVGGEDEYPTARVWGPDCSDGRVDSADHQSHMAYSDGGRCPEGYYPVPLVRMDVRYPIGTDVEGAKLSSGSPYTYHADYFDAWKRGAFADILNVCIRDGSGCNIKETKAIAGQ